jgi:hypothetical protein
MLSRRVGTALDGAFLCKAALALEKELFTLSPTELAGRS